MIIYEMTLRDAKGRIVKQEKGYVHIERWLTATGLYPWRARFHWRNL